MNKQEAGYPDIGEISKKEIVSGFKFDVYQSEDSLRKERQLVARKVPVVLDYRKDISRANIDSIEMKIAKAESLLTKSKLELSEQRDSLEAIFGINFKKQTVEFFAHLRKFSELSEAMKEVIEPLYEEGFYSEDSIPDTLNSLYYSIRRDGNENPYTPQLVMTQKDMVDKYKRKIADKFDFPDKAELARKLGPNFIKPNLIPDWETTNERRQSRMKTVDRIIETVKKDEKIVGFHEKVTPEIHRKLEAWANELNKKKHTKTFARRILLAIGWIITNTIMVFIFAFYLVIYKKKLWDNLQLFTFYLLVFFLQYTAAYILQNFNDYFILMPISLIAVLLSAFFDLEDAISALVFSTFMVFLSFSKNFLLFTEILVPGIILAIGFPLLKKRRDIYFPILLSILSSMFVIFVLEESTLGPKTHSPLELFAYHSIAIFVYALIAIFLLNFIENFLGMTSSFTLTEFATPNHQLLMQLSVEGTGTYHHSMNVATLAHNAAEEIEADPLLCRVGGYFHDIGKLFKPEYFNENDPPRSRHENLTPTESAKILISHVKDGVDLAKSNKLPEPIIDIIKQHHGTTIIKYFYKIAKSKNPEIDETDFRYPGPRPRSKEAGIIMLSDISEAAVRGLAEKTKDNIGDIVDRLINERLFNGQLDESKLTLTDINKIKKSLKNGLLGIHHQRKMGNENELPW
ncbi:MAG: HD family phosphohydrolase [Candidatus Zixiibacteriota bacterium]